MGITDYLLHISLGALIAVVFLVLVVASEFGFWLGGKLAIIIAKIRRKPFKTDLDDNVSTIANSAIGLLALFLGFAFQSAMNHFEKNRDSVSQEAQAISTFYHYSGLLNNEYGINLQKLTVQYTDTRLNLQNIDIGSAEFDKTRLDGVNIQHKMWQEIKTMLAATPDNQLDTEIVGAMSALVQSEANRYATLTNEIPEELFVPIAMFLVFNGLIMGVSLSQNKRRHVILSLGLYLLIAMAVGIIADLNRPLKGFINIDQKAMTELRNSMK